MADQKISQLAGATTPLAGTETIPLVQSGSTKKVAVSDLTAGRSVSMSALTATTTGLVGNVTQQGIFDVGISGATSNQYLTGGVGNNAATGVFKIGSGSNRGASVQGFRGVSSNVHSLDLYAYNSADIHVMRMGSGGDATVMTGNLVIGTAGKGIDFSADSSAAGMTSELLDDYEEGTWTPTLTCSDGNFTSVTYDPLRGGSYTRIGNVVHIQVYMRTDAVDNTVGRTGDVLIGGLPFSAVSGVGGTLSGHCSLAVSVASAWTGDEPIGAFISGGDNNIQLVSRSAVNGNTANITATAVNTGANANIVLIGGTYIAA